VSDIFHVFDLETTGINPLTARIVTSTILTVRNGLPARTVNLLADPGVEIPAEATAVHKITTDDARTYGLPHNDVVRESIRILEGNVPVIVYNAPYDLTLLANQAFALGMDCRYFITDTPIIDPLLLTRMLDPYQKGYKLFQVAGRFGIPVRNAHNSLDDCRVAWLVTQYLDQRFGIFEMEPEALYIEQQLGYKRWCEGFMQYKRRKDPSFDMNSEWPFQL
jgi:DNA polymerase III epsilon subunit-like protein